MRTFVDAVADILRPEYWPEACEQRLGTRVQAGPVRRPSLCVEADTHGHCCGHNDRKTLSNCSGSALEFKRVPCADLLSVSKRTLTDTVADIVADIMMVRPRQTSSFTLPSRAWQT
jgi:hypothetical protein